MRAALLLPALLLLAPGLASGQAKKTPKPVTYAEHVAPLLENKCTVCHDAEDTSGGLDLSTYEALLRGGASGEVIKAGDAEGSKLFRTVARLEQPFMPRGEGPLSKAELSVLRRWIDQGAREDGKSKPLPIKKPKHTLALPTRKAGSALPQGLPLEPIAGTSRADALVALDASPGAPLFAVGAPDQVLLYRLPKRTLAGVLPFPGRAHVVRFSQDGGLLLAAGGEGARQGRALLYDVVAGREVFRLQGGKDVYLAADLREDRRQIAVGGPTRKVEVYRVSTGELDYTLTKHTDWITSLAFSPDGVLLATGDRAGGLHVWEARTGRLYLSLPSHPGTIHALAWRPDSNVLVTGCADGQVRAYELFAGKEVKKGKAHGGGVLGLSFLADGRLLSTGRDRRLRLWATDGKPLLTTPPRGDVGLAVVADASGALLIAGDWSGRIRVWQLALQGGKGGKGGKPAAKLLATLPTNPPTIALRLRRHADALRKASRAAKRAYTAAHRARSLALRASDLQARTRRLARQAARLAARPPAAVASRRDLVSSLRAALAALERAEAAPVPVPAAGAPTNPDQPRPATAPVTSTSRRELLASLVRQAENELTSALAATEPERRHRRQLAKRARLSAQRARRLPRRAARTWFRARARSTQRMARWRGVGWGRHFWRAEADYARLVERARASQALARQARAACAAPDAARAEAHRGLVSAYATLRAALPERQRRVQAARALHHVAREAVGLAGDLRRSLSAARRLVVMRRASLAAAEAADDEQALAEAREALTRAEAAEVQLELITRAGLASARVSIQQARAGSPRALAAQRAARAAKDAAARARATWSAATRAALLHLQRALHAEAALRALEAERSQARLERARARGELPPPGSLTQ